MAAMVIAGVEGREKNAVKVFVGNLDFKITNEELAALFAPYGTVIGVNLRTERNTGRPRGFGFVTFEEQSEASAAVSAMSGRTHRERVLTVNLADVRGSADKGKDNAVERPWITTPDARPSEMREEPVEIDPNVKDWSAGVVVANSKAKKKNKKKTGASASAGAGAGTRVSTAKSWTSWAGPGGQGV